MDDPIVPEAMHTHTDVPKCPYCLAVIDLDHLSLQGEPHPCPHCGRMLRAREDIERTYTTERA